VEFDDTVISQLMKKINIRLQLMQRLLVILSFCLAGRVFLTCLCTYWLLLMSLLLLLLFIII